LIGRPGAPTQVVTALHDAVNHAQHDLVVLTPFFVPNEVDISWYRSLVNRGVGIRLLTNSLASNSGTISNSGLGRTRGAVVEAGVDLRELRMEAAARPEWETPPCTGGYLGLHAKPYVIDRYI
jgi:putative cardiolipin synthase